MIDSEQFDSKDLEINYGTISNSCTRNYISTNISRNHNSKKNSFVKKKDFPKLVPAHNTESSAAMPESFSESKSSYHSSAPSLQRAPVFNTPGMSQINRFSPSNGRLSPPHPTLFHLGQQLPPACGARQIGKLKRFLTTLVAFGNDIDPSTGERVRNLVFGLVNSTITIEEFQAKLQEATNFPLRPFVTPFLKANLPLLQRELQHCARLVKQTPGQFLLLNENFLYENLPGSTNTFTSSQSTGTAQATLLAASANSSTSLSSITSVTNPVASAVTSLFHNSVLKEAMSSLNLPKSLDNLSESRKRPAPTPSKEESQDPSSSPHCKRVMSSSPQSGLNHHSPPTGSAALNLSTGIQFNDSLDNDKESLLHSINSLRSNNSFTLEHLGMNQAEEWRHLNDMLKTLPELILNISHTVRKIEEYHRREKEEINCLLQDRHHTSLLRSPNEMIEIKRRIDEAVNDVRRQSKLELQKVITATEERALESIARERNQFEKTIEEIQKKASEEALAILNFQADDAEHCRNCGRKASETCSGCNTTRYCGSFCQHKDWERHQVECGTPTFMDESKPLHVDCEDAENLSIKSNLNNQSRDSDKESEDQASTGGFSSKKNSKSSDNEES